MSNVPTRIHSPPCRQEQLQYEPAKAVELQWFLAPVQGRMCAIAAAQIEQTSIGLLYVAAALGGATIRPPSALEAPSVSTLRCGKGRIEYLEPLTGIGRHPFAAVWKHRWSDPPMKIVHNIRSNGSYRCVPRVTTDIFNLGYLILQGACGPGGIKHLPQGPTQQGKGRALLFDLGCADAGQQHMWTGGNSNGTFRGTQAGPSLPLLVSMYRHNCIEFDAIYAWELQKFEQTAWFANIPEAMRSRISFYNVGVELPNKTRSSTGDVLARLRATALPRDFVVMKVDFDAIDIEWALVNAIAFDPSLAALVDEIFFEHPYWFDGFNFGWGKVRSPNTHTVDEVLALMRKLREVGVRSHFWV